MIQRVQTLFLLVVTLLSGFMIFYPLYGIRLKTGEKLFLHSYALQNGHTGELIHYNILLFMVILAITIISFITILYYNKRTIQMRLCVYNILISLFLIGCIAYYYFSIKRIPDVERNSFTFTVIFPVINIILLFQSFRAIRRDDLLIKSYDRLR
jgi:hypothetical protein